MLNKNKKNKKKIKTLGILIITTILFLTAIQINAQETKDSQMEVEISKNFNIEQLQLKKASTTIKSKIKSSELRLTDIDIPILTSGEFDIQKPSITTNGNELLVVAEEKQGLFLSDVIITYSSDRGSTWANPVGFTGLEDTMEDKPDIDYTGVEDFQAYGSCLPDPMTGDLLLFHFPSMTDPEVVWEESQGWTVWTVGLAGSYEDFRCVDLCGYPYGEDIAPTPDFHGMITYSCVDVDTGLDTFGFIYETDDGGLSIIFMGDVLGDIGNVASDIDLSNGEFIFAIEWENEPDLIEDGVFLDLQYLEPGNDNWWEKSWTEITFEGAHNPDVAADGGNCYLVYDMINPTFGYTDIYCAHSTDNFQTYQIDRVTQTDLENEYYPSVTAIGQTVTCSYIRDGDLYTATSEDGGVTWEESIPINDISGSVSEELYSADITGGRYVVWTTDIESTKGINFDTLELDIAIPEIEFVTGGIGVSASIKNVGTVTATDIPWSIDIDGPVLFGSHKEGVITNLAAGNSETIRIPLVLGLGTVSITVNAGGVQKQEEGKVILFFVTGL